MHIFPYELIAKIPSLILLNVIYQPKNLKNLLSGKYYIHRFKKKSCCIINCVGVRVCACVCVCVCVCVYFLPPSRLLLTEKNNKCNARDQARDVVLRKLLCVKYLHRYVIDNHSRDLQASNCARVSIKPGRATRSKRQLLKLSKNQR